MAARIIQAHFHRILSGSGLSGSNPHSGLDIDALRVVANGVNSLRTTERAIVMVTHYQRLIDYIEPDFVHVLSGGRILRSGDRTLALELEKRGYDRVRQEAGAA